VTAPVAITFVLGASGADRRAASAAAERFGLPLLVREERALAEVAKGREALLIVGARHLALFAGGREHRWNPGMGALRLKRGPDDPTRDAFLEAAELAPGDRVLDCTLGLGADALVAAGAVGPSGRVLGLESSPALAAFAALGLARSPLPAARRIEVRHADSAVFLAAAPARSFDVVLFDPMFRRALRQSSTFDLVRALGDARPLDAATLAQARRVARRQVVVKDASPGWDLTRLDLSPLPCSRGAKRLYARALPTP
jgi:hypothetical protein